MLKRNDDGLYFVSDKTGKMYHLDQGYGVGGDEFKTSDILYVITTGMTEKEYEDWCNNENAEPLEEKFVGFFYGASFLDSNFNEEDDAKENVIVDLMEIIDGYENKAFYNFTFDELDWFYGNIEDDALKELSKMQNGGCVNQDNLDINIRVGNHYVTVPYTDDNYIMLNNFILDCRKETIDLVKESKEENYMKASTNYVIKEFINNSCYPETFHNVFKLLYINNINGWEAMEFLNFLYRRAKEAEDKYYETHVPTNVYFVIYDRGKIDDEKENYMALPSIEYDDTLEYCLKDPIKILKYYKICMTEDCYLAEIVPKTKTIDEQILDTLIAYQETHEEVFSALDNESLLNQIEYMRQKIKKDG